MQWVLMALVMAIKGKRKGVKRYGGFMIGFTGYDDLEKINKLRKNRRQKWVIMRKYIENERK